MHKSIFNWSGGKDSALCLHNVLQQGNYHITTLLTTLSEATQRVTMHGVRQELLERQAQSINLPLTTVLLPESTSMSAYNLLMENTLRPIQQAGVTHSIFGDINLQDLREYREQQLHQVHMQAVFPLWGQPTKTLVHEFISLGFKAIVVCVNEQLLDASFAGRILDETFLEDLPPGVDPGGENGEFHTFVFDGPIFTSPVLFTVGETVHKTYGVPASKTDNCFSKDPAPAYNTGFWFCDLLPA